MACAAGVVSGDERLQEFAAISGCDVGSCRQIDLEHVGLDVAQSLAGGVRTGAHCALGQFRHVAGDAIRVGVSCTGGGEGHFVAAGAGNVYAGAVTEPVLVEGGPVRIVAGTAAHACFQVFAHRACGKVVGIDAEHLVAGLVVSADGVVEGARPDTAADGIGGAGCHVVSTSVGTVSCSAFAAVGVTLAIAGVALATGDGLAVAGSDCEFSLGAAGSNLDDVGRCRGQGVGFTCAVAGFALDAGFHPSTGHAGQAVLLLGQVGTAVVFPAGGVALATGVLLLDAAIGGPTLAEDLVGCRVCQVVLDALGGGGDDVAVLVYPACLPGVTAHHVGDLRVAGRLAEGVDGGACGHVLKRAGDVAERENRDPVVDHLVDFEVVARLHEGVVLGSMADAAGCRADVVVSLGHFRVVRAFVASGAVGAADGVAGDMDSGSAVRMAAGAVVAPNGTGAGVGYLEGILVDRGLHDRTRHSLVARCAVDGICLVDGCIPCRYNSLGCSAGVQVAGAGAVLHF